MIGVSCSIPGVGKVTAGRTPASGPSKVFGRGHPVPLLGGSPQLLSRLSSFSPLIAGVIAHLITGVSYQVALNFLKWVP